MYIFGPIFKSCLLFSDFEDAVLNIDDSVAVKEINLVADSIRLGGAILKYYPEMLAAQLNGRLLPERQTSRNIRSLLQQCDEEGIHQNALGTLKIYFLI